MIWGDVHRIILSREMIAIQAVRLQVVDGIFKFDFTVSSDDDQLLKVWER